ncbi:MAG: LLM class flavin-dependent oxidoreductase, partial [Actinobacteria bacterium]|nr:LLM class flavin-dependent oxidoreductase [Actinomycetota bacterium]
MPTMRCALIGADTLLIECAQMLMERGHEIVAVGAGSDRVATWAVASEIPVQTVDTHDYRGWCDQWAAELQALSVDYLFAITHLQLLPAVVVSAATRMAINFHDGPLPEYAGLNTPVWGILRNEAEWGVSWHRIDEGVDTGAVLVQRRFAMAERETSLSLNTRNFEEALDSFGDVLDLLGSDAGDHSRSTRPRSAYRRSDLPDGVLDFRRSAADVDRVVRALHFGAHLNPVAAALLWHPLICLVVDSCEIVEGSAPPAGTLTAANDDGLLVACSDGLVLLSGLRTVDGVYFNAGEFSAVTGAQVGSVLPPLDESQRQWLTESAFADQSTEQHLLDALGGLAAVEFPWPHGTAGGTRAKVSIPTDARGTPSAMLQALQTLLMQLSLAAGDHIALALPTVPEFARPLVSSVWPLDLRADLQRPRHWRLDLLTRTPGLAARWQPTTALGLPIGVRLSTHDGEIPGAIVVLQPATDGAGWEIDFDTAAVEASAAKEFARCLAVTTRALAERADATEPIALLPADTLDRVVHRWNATDGAFNCECIHEVIERQVALTPHRRAVTCAGQTLTFHELDERAHGLAVRLQSAGVEPDSLVGVHVDRGTDLLVAVLAVLKAGGAYVPLDPGYPDERLQHMIRDSGAEVIVCQRHHQASLPLPPGESALQVVVIDQPETSPADSPPAGATTPLRRTVQPGNLAYCIYTSGSSGTPKGVLVEHRNVANLFAAMDAVVERGDDDKWFAVSSLAFDISVVELLYTIARGIEVVVYVPDAQSTVVAAPPAAMDFSLFYFAADEASAETGGKYRLLLEGARFADANGFCAVWTPERHFHSFGGLYPNPAVTAAAVAAVTENVSVRAGSVVLPLHHPVEIAETWSVVDNLSNGRVGVGFASGWQPNDFILRPQNYSRSREMMYEGIDQIRRLWRGETLTFDGPDDLRVDVATLPRPVQTELPVWITTAGDPESFAKAGTIGANVLTHLLGQSIEQLAPKLQAYRAARAAAGHDPATGKVALMLHAFVGDDEAMIRETVHAPLRNYLQTAFNLVRDYAWSFPTFRRPDGRPIAHPSDLTDEDVANLAPDDLDAVLDFAVKRYYETSGLFGTPERVLPRLQQLREMGVDEIACLIDFGVATDTVLAHLQHLANVRDLTATHTAARDNTSARSLADQIVAAGATHIQCTPSMARMFTSDPTIRAALGDVEQLLVGGEALAGDLADELASLVGGGVTNMYGPTETTVWSGAWRVQPKSKLIPIGGPLTNTRFYVLDADRCPVPPGVAGHLWIAGAGVARGYHRRDDLTNEKFVTDPFCAGERMYDTGDLARWREQPNAGAVLEFLGRCDQQVKLRGHRIELGEIEAELRRIDGIEDCAAVVSRRDDDSDQQLVAYIVTETAAEIDTDEVRRSLRKRLPEVMVPGHVIVLPSLPRTPTGKLDKRSLPARGGTERA